MIAQFHIITCFIIELCLCLIRKYRNLSVFLIELQFFPTSYNNTNQSLKQINHPHTHIHIHTTTSLWKSFSLSSPPSPMINSSRLFFLIHPYCHCIIFLDIFTYSLSNCYNQNLNCDKYIYIYHDKNVVNCDLSNSPTKNQSFSFLFLRLICFTR